MRATRCFFVLTILMLISSCASSYKVPDARNLSYISSTSSHGLKLFYKYDVLENKYAKKELKTGIKVIGVKITNNSNEPYTFGRNLMLYYSNGNEVQLVEPEMAFKSLKQGSAIYLLYLLATPINLYTYKTDSNGFQRETSSTPIGAVLGPGLTLSNVLVSSSANARFRSHLLGHNIVGKVIAPGETISGFIPIRSSSFDSLVLKPIK